MVCCESRSESQNYKSADPYIGQEYKGDGGSKSGLMCWTDGMESAPVRVGCVFSACWICLEVTSLTFSHSKCVCLIAERTSCINVCMKVRFHFIYFPAKRVFMGGISLIVFLDILDSNAQTHETSTW